MNTPEQDMEDRAMSYSLDDEEAEEMERKNGELMAVLGTINGQITDALGRDPLDVLLEGGDRMLKRKQLHEDIAEYDRQARDFEEEMWRAMSRMRELKAHKAEAEKQLQALGAKP